MFQKPAVRDAEQAGASAAAAGAATGCYLLMINRFVQITQDMLLQKINKKPLYNLNLKWSEFHQNIELLFIM